MRENMENKRKVGKIRAAHGIKGEVSLYIFSDEYDWFENVKSIYVESKTKPGQWTEYKIKEFRPHKNDLLLQLVGIDTRNQSEALQGSMVWVDSEIFVTSDDEEGYFLTEIENFTVFNGDLEIGTVHGFSFNGDHDLIIVKPKDSGAQDSVEELTIPLVDDFIEEIDFENKKIFMNLPEGLLEVQTE